GLLLRVRHRGRGRFVPLGQGDARDDEKRQGEQRERDSGTDLHAHSSFRLNYALLPRKLPPATGCVKRETRKLEQVDCILSRNRVPRLPAVSGRPVSCRPKPTGDLSRRMPPTTYDASAIEVLTGLEPVRKRPGMYTFTDRPDHLAQEVIANSVDEGVAGHAGDVFVPLYADGSLAVTDDGRGMPIDQHPGERVSGVEVILTRLHAGAKFSDKSYRFSGGLHGV